MVSKSKPNIEYYEGEWRRPINDLQNQVVGGGHKSLHDPETAAAAGLTSEGGGPPIHGTVHFSQLTPLLLKVYGKEWFERGTISVSFKHIVSHLQPVKAFIEKPPSPKQQVKIWMEHIDGRLVFDGTASLVGQQQQEDSGGKQTKTMVDQQIQKIKPLKGNLVFIPHKVNTHSLNTEQVCIEWDQVIGPLFPFTNEEKLNVITEWHPWFSREYAALTSPWKTKNGDDGEGRAILSPEALNQIMFYTIHTAKWPTPTLPQYNNLLPNGKTPLGLFGGCEIKMHHGPVFVGTKYYLSREIVGVGETPRTEFRWTRTVMRDGEGRIVAEMRLQDMMLKGSVEGYDELRKVVNEKSKL